MTTFVGLDLSLAGTAAVQLDSTGSVVRVLAYSTSEREVARFAGHRACRIYPACVVQAGDAQGSWQRTLTVADDLAAWLGMLDAISLVGIEDHAFSMRGNVVYQLGHLHGLVRAGLSRYGRSFLLVEPSANKLLASGKGRAEKRDMVAATEAAGFDLSPFGASVKHNVADAYWVAQAARIWALLRDGKLKLAELPPHQRRVFSPNKRSPGLAAREPICGW